MEGLQGRWGGPGRACACWALQAPLPWPRAPLRFVAVIGVAHPVLFRGLLAMGLVVPSLSWGVQALSCPATCLVCFPLPELEGYLPTWWNILTFLFHSFCLLSFSLKETVSPN